MPPMDTNLGTGNGPAILDHQRPPSNHPKKPPHGSQRWTTDAVDPQPDREVTSMEGAQFICTRPQYKAKLSLGVNDYMK